MLLTNTQSENREVSMKEELRNLIIKLQVSNARLENLMDNIGTAKELLGQYKNCLRRELETSDGLANKIGLELLMDDAVKARPE